MDWLRQGLAATLALSCFRCWILYFAVWSYGSYVALIKFWDVVIFKIIKVFLGTVPGLGSPTNLIYLTVTSWHTRITLTIVRSIILLWKLLLKKESLKLGKIINLLFYRKKLLEPDQLKVSFKVLELTRESGREGRPFWLLQTADFKNISW